MAKSESNKQLNLDDYDFGSEFDDFEEFSLEPKPPKNKREAIERIGGGAWEGAKDTLKSPSFFREFIKKALPRGFGNIVDLADQGATSVRELYNEGQKETKPLFKDVGRMIDKMMPASSKYVPKSAEKVLKGFADKYRDKPELGIGANNATDMAVAALMTETFKYNAQDNARQEAKNDVREAIRDTVANNRHNDSQAQLDGIRRSVVSMASYQRRIEYSFHKKSLELQARQYYVTLDLLNETKRNNVRSSEMMAGILRNTSLPDLLKMTTSEKFKDMLRNRVMNGLQDGIFGQRANFMQNLGKAFREQAMGSLRTFAGGMRDGISGLEMAADSAQMAEEMGMDRFRTAGNIVGSQTTQWLGGLAGSKVGKKLMGSNGQAGKTVRRVGNRLQHFSENAPQIATDWSNRHTNVEDSVRDALDNSRLPDGLKSFLSKAAGFVGNPLTDLLKGTVRRANATDTTVKEKGIADLYAPTQFSNQAHKSLVEVIPGYLARIYQELQITRTGDTSIDLTQYDFTRGSFTSTKALRKAVFERLFDKTSRDGVAREKNTMLEMLDPTGKKLNAKQREELAQLLMNDNMGGRVGYQTGKISNYLNEGNFNGSKNGKKFAKLFQALAEKNKAAEGNLENDFAGKFRNMGRSSATRQNEIQDLLDVYPRDMLEDMGLLKPGSRQIDMERVQRYFGGTQYNAKGNYAAGGLRHLGGGGAQLPPVQIPLLPAANDTASGSTVAEEIKRLIELIELQNTKPLVSDIKDILIAMQAQMGQPGGQGGPSTLDRLISGAGSVAGASTRGARRLQRQTLVATERLRRQHQAQLDEARKQAQRQAKRLQRQAVVQAGRLRQRYQPQIDQAQEMMGDYGQQARELWGNRPSMGDLGDMLRNRWGQLQSRASGAYDHLHSDAFREQMRNRMDAMRNRAGAAYGDARNQVRTVGGALHANIQNATEEMRRRNAGRGDGERDKGILAEIKDILTAIHDRLEDGIITTGGVPEGRLRGSLRRVGGATRRGLSKLNMRLTDVVKGGFGLATGSVRLAAGAVNGLVGGSARLGWGAIKGTAGLVGDGLGFAASSQYRRARGFVDIYVGNERKPRLFGRMLQEGNVYFDKESGKPIRRLKDIVGDVMRKDKNGEEIVVLSADEIEHAWQKVGPVKKSLKALGAGIKGAYGIGKKIFGTMTAGIPPVFKAAFWVAKKAWGLLDMAQDIFIKDRLDSPAMTARVMRAGGYHSAVTGNIIKRPSQIDGPVLSGDETVLTHDDLRKGLVDKNNKPIRTGFSKLWNFAFGNVKRVAKLAWKAGKLVNDAGVGLIKGGWKLGKKGVNAAIGLSGGTLDILRGKNPFKQGPSAEITKKAVALQTEQTSYLKEIRDLLKERLPKRKNLGALDSDGDGDRDGSYEDQMKQKAEAEKAAAQNKPGVGSGLKGGAMSLWNKLRGKEEETDEDGNIINVEGGDKDKDKSRDARRKRRLARRPGGSWATSQGWKGKAKFLGKQGWGAAKTAGKWGLRLGAAALSMGGLGIGSGALAGAGGAIAAGATAVGGALLAAGTAVAGVLASPVVIGALVVGALAYGAYRLYTRKTLGLLSRVRYVQYGFAPTDKDHLATVFGLEDKLKDAIIYGKEGAKLDPKRVDPTSLFKDFDVEEKDAEAMNNWLQWFATRFRPVFLTHVTALKATAGDKWLSDVDNLEAPTALKYLNLVRFPEGPYSVDTSPFKDLKKLPSGGGDVKAIIQIADMELKKKAPDDKAKVAGVAAGAVAAGAAVSGANKAPAGTAGGKAVSAKALAAATAPASAMPAKGAQVMAAGSSTILNSLGVDRLDGVDVVRLKTYGLVKMEVDKVKALKALETYLAPKLIYNKDVASWSGSVEQVLLDNGPAFGVDSSNDNMTANWISWFNQRFLPVFLNYATLMKAQTGKEKPEDGKIALKAAQAVDVATALYTTSSMSGSVWNVSVSPWADYELNSDVRSTDGNMQGLKDMSKTAVLVEPNGKGANQPTAGKSAANTENPGQAAKPGGIMGGLSSFWDRTKSFFGGSSSAPATAPTTPQVGNNPYGATVPSSMSGGNAMTHPGRGTGGDINSIPLPKGNKSWSALKDTILGAAQMVGVDGKLMAAMAAIESGFDYTIKAKTSSATGLFQFVTDTWNYMLKKHGAKYGIAPGTPPTDPRANALMGAEYLKESVNALEGRLGRPITDTDIYFSHFLGPGGARKFLTADPNAIAAQVMPDAAAVNRSIFYAKNGTPQTVGQVYQLLNGRLQGKARKLINDGGESMVTPSAPTTPTPPGSKAAAPEPKDANAEKTPVAPVGLTPPKPTDTKLAPTAAPMAQPTPSAPSNNGVPIGVLAGGFMPPRSTQDQMSTARQQNDARAANMESTNTILTDSLKVHRESVVVLKEIRDNLVKLPGLVKGMQPDPTNVTPTSQDARTAERRNSELPRAPVSVARPQRPYG